MKRRQHTHSITLRFSPADEARLNEIARQTEHSRGWIMRQLVREVSEDQINRWTQQTKKP